ncbi:queuosine 5'-phosphate N-glycosylase/hydrolase isoform X2 [Tiliqua scincoides]
MTLEQVRNVFRSDTDVPMPLIEERHCVLNETGTVLLEKFGGSFLTCVKKSEKSAQKLLQLIVENFPSFRDEATFQGRKVAFYKRAQILVADTWSVLEGKGDGCFSDISSVTIFADYRIPQVLVHLGAMKYSDGLMKQLKEGHMFQSGDQQEMEIRGCSIWCCELICNRLLDLYKKKGKNMSEKINAVLLDYYLWDYARDHREDMKGIPFHRVRCIYY